MKDHMQYLDAELDQPVAMILVENIEKCMGNSGCSWTFSIVDGQIHVYTSESVVTDW